MIFSSVYSLSDSELTFNCYSCCYSQISGFGDSDLHLAGVYMNPFWVTASYCHRIVPSFLWTWQTYFSYLAVTSVPLISISQLGYCWHVDATLTTTSLVFLVGIIVDKWHYLLNVSCSATCYAFDPECYLAFVSVVLEIFGLGWSNVRC